MASSIKLRRKGRIDFRLAVDDTFPRAKINAQHKVGGTAMTKPKVNNIKNESPAKLAKIEDHGVSHKVITGPRYVKSLYEKMIRCMEKEKEMIEASKKELIIIGTPKRELKRTETVKQEMKKVECVKNDLEMIEADIKNYAGQGKRKRDNEEGERKVKLAKTDNEDESLALTNSEISKTDVVNEPTIDNVEMLNEAEDMMTENEQIALTDDEIIAEIGDIDAFLAD